MCSILYIIASIIISQCGDFIHVHVVSASTTALTKSAELHNILLSNYNKDDIPTLMTSTLPISLTFHLTSIMDLNEIEGEMVTVGYLTAIWVDKRLSWNPLEYFGISSIMIAAEKIWTPNLVLANPSKKISDFNKDLTRARVLYNGTVILMPGDVFRTRCEFNIFRYPFDDQICRLSFIAWPYLASEVFLQIANDDVTTPFFHENGEWDLIGSSTLMYVKNRISVAEFQLNLERKYEFFVVNIILPIALICFLACLAFLIPHESGERMSYTITVLLSFAVFMTLVSDNIPKNSAPMSLLCYYLFGIFFGSVILMLSVIFTSQLFHRKNSIPVTNGYKKFTNCFKCKKSPYKHAKNKIHVISGNVTKDDDVYKYIKKGKGNACLDTKDAEITWQDVARHLDRLLFVTHILYYCSISLGIVLYVQLNKMI